MDLKFRPFYLLALLSIILCIPLQAQSDKKTISGVVLDTEQEPVIGATIVLKGTPAGTITDLDGRFQLEVTPGATLVVSYIGCTTQEIRVTQQTEYKIVLQEDALDLDEVVVIGYGTARKRDLTGAIASVKTEKLQTEAPRSVQDLLRGNVPGLNISMNGKAKGDGDLIIRGKSTLRDNAGGPLLVLDGVIYDGALSDLNPNDIASVDVLKDASSAAVYGAKAGNGVVVIMTHKGSNRGKPVVNFNASVGWETMANKRKVLSPEGYIQFRQDYEMGRYSDDYYERYPEIFTDPRKLQGVNQLDWYNYDMQSPVTSVSETDLITKWLSRLDFKTPEINNYLDGRITNWEDVAYQTGLQQNYSASVSNRTETTSYYWSLGWQDRESIYAGDRFTRLSSRLNLETQINPYLSVGMNMNFATRNEGFLTADWGQVRHLSPYAANELDDPESPYRRYPTGDVNSLNPLYDNLYRDRKNLTTTLNGTIFGKLTLPFGFEYQMNFTPHLSWKEYFNHDSAENESWAAAGGSAERTHEKWFNWQVDNVFRWKREFARKHNVEVTFLVNAEKNQYWKTESKTSNFTPSDILGYHNMDAGTIPRAYSNDTYSTGDALMGRLFYSYENKYMITASIRRDGYSAFGKENPRATFPAVAVGWTFTSEKFAQAINSWMSYGKLRFSWGQNGNRDIGIYDALADLNSSLTPLIDQSGNLYLLSQIYVRRMANYNLKWENTSSYNIGLDFAIFNDILSGSVDLYNKRTNDLLVNRALPRFTGYENVTANLGQIENKGIEIFLNASIMRVRNFEWDATGTFSLNRRKILKLYGDMVDVLDENGNVIGQREADDTRNNWFIGKDPDQIWDYVRDGVWQLGEEEEAAKYGCAPGDFKYVDQDGDGYMTDEDKVFQKYKTPRFRWSLRNNFRIYNDFEFSFMLYSLWGQHGTFNDAANDVFADRRSNYDYPRWTKDNPTNDYARIGSYNVGNNYVSRSFIRLDNIALTYRVPKKYLQKALIQDMRVTGTIKNVAVFAPSWKNMWDPETGEPYGRSFTLGINFTL
ncbi:MAG: SusC/RagA family TonB-linked outer membrane protein [Tannerellaceae bacterium]|nr:SusC/RagA family TonB-linked outer membrane protein [Tannerellaceae bacterium]